MKKTAWMIALAAASLPLAHRVQAADACIEHFASEGNFLSGKTYKTWATLPAVRARDGYARAYAYTADNGFTITGGDKEAGVITAVQSATVGKSKGVPLNIVLRDDSDGLRVSMTYTTPTGVLSPDDAVQKHFCSTIAAVASDGASGNATLAAGTSKTASRGDGKTVPGYASATPEQVTALNSAVGKNIPNDKIRAMVSEAEPTITGLVERLSCLAEYNGASALNTYAAPGTDLGSLYVMLRPMRTTSYHSKTSCLTVTRIHGWTAPARNALRFEAVYTADDSGETAKTKHELVKQPDGSWLATNNVAF